MQSRKQMSFLCGLLVLFITAPAAANYSDSGTIPYPRPYVHTIQCNPGDSIQVSVSTNRTSSVDILYKALTNSGWAYNCVAQSRKKTSHYLEYTAPGGKPTNNMAYWHYDVAIHNATSKRTKFSFEIK